MSTETTQNPPRRKLPWIPVIDVACMVLLLGVGVSAFGPVFSGTPGYVAAGGGALLGAGIAILSAWRGWSFFTTASVALAAFVLFGGALALPGTTVAGILPTLETVQRLVLLTFQGWRDLLTVSVPANAFTGPAVVPYLSGLVCSLLTVSAALRMKRHLWALVPALLLLLIGILWGTKSAPAAAAGGVVFAVTAVGWAAWRVTLAQHRANAHLLTGGRTNATAQRQRAMAAVGILAVSTLVAITVGSSLATATDRYVLRDSVVPPLNLRDYASPLTRYRYYERNQKDETVMTVSGLPEGARIRLAALDVYDGHVYNVDANSAGFMRVGDQIGTDPDPQDVTTLDITLGAYEGVWLPGGGDLTAVRFKDERLAAGLHFNPDTGTALTTVGLRDSATYEVDLRLRSQPTDSVLAKDSIAGRDMPASDGVPEEIISETPTFAGTADSQIAQLRRIEEKFREIGFYPNDEKSMAGHYTRRLSMLFTNDKMVGDDEQYATAMALMVRQLGYPARVVLGFYPEETNSGPLELTGYDAHVWVEVPFEKEGWVAFDPTPDRDKRPDTKVPKPDEIPRPQVLPPPAPPEEPIEPPEDETDDARNRQDDEGLKLDIPESVKLAVYDVGGAALLASPWVLIALLKRTRRTRRRRLGQPADRISGGWSEVLDTAADLGSPASPRITRQETARELAERYAETAPLAVAERVDAHVFGAGEPADEDVEEMWRQVDDLLDGMRGSVGRWRRVRAAVSVKSLLGQRRDRPTEGDLPTLRQLLGRVRDRVPGMRSREEQE